MLALADQNGEIHATIPGLARMAGVTIEDAEVAISKFLGPDKYSRTSDHDGRRIVEIDGGWELLNHEKYRKMGGRPPTKEKQQDLARPMTYVKNEKSGPRIKCGRSSIPKGRRFDVLNRDNFQCQYCGKSAPEVKLHIDHVVPVSSGGTNSIDNLKTACSECNVGKSDKPLVGGQAQ